MPSKRLNTRTENVNVFLVVLLFNVLKSFCIWSNDFLKKLLNLTLVPWLSSPPPCVNVYFYMRVVLILQWSSLNLQSLFHFDCLYDWVWSANYTLCWRYVKRWWILRAPVSAVDLVCRLRTLRAPWLRALEAIFLVEQITRWTNLEFCALGRCALWRLQQLLSFPSVSGYCVYTRADCFLSLRVYRTTVQRDLQETRFQDKRSLYHLLMTLPLNLPHWLSKEWQLQGRA